MQMKPTFTNVFLKNTEYLHIIIEKHIKILKKNSKSFVLYVNFSQPSNYNTFKQKLLEENI